MDWESFFIGFIAAVFFIGIILAAYGMGHADGKAGL